MTYCMVCGCKLDTQYLETEGDIPYCPDCASFRFPIFNTAVSMIVLNKQLDKVLLIQQYQKQAYILVAGYINKGENAEAAVSREIAEEVGLSVSQVQANHSEYYAPSNTLMLNYVCVASQESVTLTDEVDAAKWFPLAEARQAIKANSLAKRFLESFLDKHELGVAQVKGGIK